MALPKHVQAYAEEMEQYEKELEAQQQSAAPEGDDPSADDAPDETPPMDESDGVTQSPSSESQPAESPASKQPDSKWDNEEEKWEHKYRRLQGKYDAEVPRLHAELKDANARLQKLEQALEQKAQAEPAPQEEAKPVVTQEDIDAFGEDLVDLQRRIAADVVRNVQGELEKLRTENAELRKSLQDTGSQIGAVSFEQQLYQLIPDFGQINTDKRWIEWLNEFEPMIQGPRRAVVQDAYTRGDAQAVKGYVDLWRQTVGEKKSTKADRQQELQKQVQPSRAHNPSPPDRGGQKTYSDQEARNIFARIQKLVTQGRYDEAAKLENEISAAYAEGRVAV